MKTALLLDMLAGVLAELDTRAQGVDTMVETGSGASIDTEWGTVKRDESGAWTVCYYSELSAYDAHGVNLSDVDTPLV